VVALNYNSPDGKVNISNKNVQYGLSTAHIVTKNIQSLTIYEENKHHIRKVKRHKYPAEMTFYDGGSLISVKREHWKIPQRGGGLRGAIKTFSYNSRRRLMRRIAQLRKDKLPLFVTLTYPNEFPQDSKVYKEHLRRLGIALDRKYKRIGFFWRLEFQKRGAPHYHLLLFGVSCKGKEIQVVRQWFAITWYKIVNSGDEKHLLAGTQVSRMKNWRQLSAYVSKSIARVENGELGKDTQATMEYVGRWYGVVGAKYLPFADVVIAKITDKVACDVIRYMRRFANLKYTRAYRSLSIFADGHFWLSKCEMLLYPDGAIP
jgi:hypothetical protein